MLTSADVARLGADHMRFLGFHGVFVRPRTNGVGNVVAIDAVAHAAHDAEGATSQFITAGRSAAPGRSRLVYDASSDDVHADHADRHDTALFRFHLDGAVVAANECARALTARYSPPARRTPLGALTFFGRQTRAAAWLEQIAGLDFLDSAVSTDTLLIDRAGAAHSRSMVDALTWLRAARDPESSLSERVHALVSAETALKRAASTLGVRLR